MKLKQKPHIAREGQWWRTWWWEKGRGFVSDYSKTLARAAVVAAIAFEQNYTPDAPQ